MNDTLQSFMMISSNTQKLIITKHIFYLTILQTILFGRVLVKFSAFLIYNDTLTTLQTILFGRV